LDRFPKALHLAFHLKKLIEKLLDDAYTLTRACYERISKQS